MLKSANYRRPRTAKVGYINLSDFRRIQNEIINEPKQTREQYEQTLRAYNQTHLSKFPEEIKPNLKEREKEEFIQNELRRRKLDEIENEYNLKEKEMYRENAKKLNFLNQDDIKSFNSKLLTSDCLNERKFQENINKLKKETEKKINERYYQKELEQMEEFDRKENEKLKILNQKKQEQMKIINDQLQQARMKKLEEKEEKDIEGLIMQKQYEKGLEEDKKKEEEKRQHQKFLMQEFIEGNQQAQKLKQENAKKELELDRKIQLEKMKKDKLEDLKKKHAKEIFEKKQEIRQKIIDEQIKNLEEIKQEQERILNKQIKEAEEKKDKEEKIKQARYNKLKKEMEENREKKRKENELKKIKAKKDDKDFIENWKMRMKQLEKDEQEEKNLLYKRNKDLQKYHINQINEHKKKEEIEKNKKKGIQEKTRNIIKDERDDYMEYVLGWVDKYQKEGKDITPLIIEINKYRRRNGLNEFEIKSRYKDKYK